jgi:ATP-dependent helicase/nuclease subunit A
MERWTADQARAINRRGSNILVSAAAGSGKTAVLVERIKRLVLGDNEHDPVPIDRILVVTFTEAAASEMRQKIVFAIEDEITAFETGDEKRRTYLERQLQRINTANISTFHAFALTILKRYSYLIGMQPSFTICDEFSRRLLLSEAMDKLFEEKFEEEDEEFIDFLKCYASAKNEDAVREMITNLYNFVQAIPERFDWIDEHIEELKSDITTFLKSKAFERLSTEMLDSLNSALRGFVRVQDILDSNGLPGLAMKAQADVETIANIRDRFEQDGWAATSDIIQDVKYMIFRAGKEEKETYDDIKELITPFRDTQKKQIKNLKDNYFNKSLDEHIADINHTYSYAHTLASLVKRFHLHFTEAKARQEVIDFNDIEHLALKMLEDPRVCNEYKEKFAHVFIDEYQDTNYVQERLIAAITRDDNLFMVGDVKQSIYRFRQAEPEIFINKYNEVFSGDENAADHKIDLNLNFRSKGSVINNVNGIFSSLMDEELSGIAYDEKAALHRGLDYEALAYDGALDVPTRVILADIPAKPSPGEEDLGDSESADELMAMKSVEVEAHAAAEIIRSTVYGDGKESTFFDAKKGVTRRFALKDIVILLREVRNSGPVYQEILQSEGIDAYVDSNDGYFDRIEVETFMNLLRMLDNLRQDIPLVSALYSQVFGFSLDELIRIRLRDKSVAFHRAFAAICEDEGISAGSLSLQSKCRDALEKIEGWRKDEMFMELSEFIWHLMKSSGYYDYAGALVGGAQRKANLRALVDRASDFQKSGIGGLAEFISFIDAIKEEKIPVGQVKVLTEADNVVRIMSVHTSKGLEFPMVIVGQLTKKLDVNSREGRMSLHKDIGIALQWEDYATHSYRKTLLQKTVKARNKREERAEHIRILYVALTRAMDRLVLLGAGKKIHENFQMYDALYAEDGADVLQAKSFLEMLAPIVAGKGFEVLCTNKGK